jgi:amidophosphoribosyltransferase
VLLNIFADEIHRAHKEHSEAKPQDLVFDAVAATMRQLQGTYSIVSLVCNVGLLAFRDPHGVRPLVLGYRVSDAGAEWCFASEDCAFGPLGFTKVRDVRPGEAILIDEGGEMISRQLVEGQLSPCIFEYIYLARPDTVMNDISVYEFQLDLGRRLAAHIRDAGWAIDTVVPVPDGSRPAAIEIASALGLPYREGLVKNRYIGRTFILGSQRLREISVRRKLNAMRTVFAGKSVLLVDDSIVRGTTMSQIVAMCRAAGAHKVYLASASPPVRYPNFYGIDLPSRKEFVANGLTNDEICRVLGADGLLYQSIEDLLEVGRQQSQGAITRWEDSCFTGDYVTGVDAAFVERVEERGRGKDRGAPAAPTLTTPVVVAA